MQLQRSRRRCRAHRIWINEMLAGVALLLPLLALANFSSAQATGKCEKKNKKQKTKEKTGNNTQQENTLFLHAF